MEKISSEGKCIFCKETFAQSGMNRHLQTHFKKMETEGDASKHTDYYHVYVKGGVYFLHLLLKKGVKLSEVDGFLRKIWLECCGHLSEFSYKGGKVGKTRTIEAVFKPKEKLEYEYDFGSTTTLELTFFNSYKLDLKDKIILLSRNEPLKIMCGVCNAKPATCMCSVCQYEKYSFFCEDCSEQHAGECSDFEDYARMEVVNSPRMGECAYDGGSIDIERDGVYEVK